MATIVSTIAACLVLARKAASFPSADQIFTLPASAHINWNGLSQMCYLSRASSAYTAVWAIPVRDFLPSLFYKVAEIISKMGFELVVIALVVYHALAHPRVSIKSPVLSLHRYGIPYFAVSPQVCSSHPPHLLTKPS